MHAHHEATQSLKRQFELRQAALEAEHARTG